MSTAVGRAFTSSLPGGGGGGDTHMGRVFTTSLTLLSAPGGIGRAWNLGSEVFCGGEAWLATGPGVTGCEEG